MYEEVCYNKSFLRLVIARVDFATPIEKLDKGVPQKLVASIVEDFPIIEPADVVMQEIAVSGSEVKSTATPSKEWNYFSLDRNSQLTLSQQTFIVQYKTYSNFEATKQQFGKVVAALTAMFPGVLASRFGLRYINQIELPLPDPTRWDDYIAAPLLAQRGFYEAAESVSRLVSIAELRYDDIGVRFQFGMPNPDFPAAIRRPVFVLDLDASVTQAHELAQTLNFIDRAHDRIQNLFERSITDELRRRMDARPVQH